MVSVHLTDSSYTHLIDIFQFAVQFFHIGEVRGNGLIEKLITEDNRLILITVCNLAPNVAIQLLTRFAFKQPGISVTIIDIITSLSARSIVHIKNQIKVSFTAPFHYTVHTGKAVLSGGQSHKVLIGEEFIMEREADSVRTCVLDELYVLTGNVIVFKRFPEFGGKVGSHQLAEHFIDETGRVGLAELKHIPFRVQPVTQIGTHDKEFRTVGLNQVLPLNCYKRGRFLCFFCLFTATA